MCLTITIGPVILVGTRRQTMLITCKKCNVQHDSRDVNNGICIWCEQKENTETHCISGMTWHVQRGDWVFKTKRICE